MLAAFEAKVFSEQTIPAFSATFWFIFLDVLFAREFCLAF